MNQSKRYSDDDLKRVLKKVTEWADESDTSSEGPAEYSLADLQSIAVEVGLDPALVEQAVRHLALKPSASREEGGVVHRQLEVILPAPMTEDQAAHVLGMTRATMKQYGIGEASPAGLAWRSEQGDITLSVSSDGARSRIQVAVDRSRTLVLSGLLGSLSGVLVALAGTVGEELTLGALVVSALVGLGVTSGTALAAIRLTRRRVGKLLAIIGRTMADTEPASPNSGGTLR